jgi:hypothetical protein
MYFLNDINSYNGKEKRDISQRLFCLTKGYVNMMKWRKIVLLKFPVNAADQYPFTISFQNIKEL